MSLWAWGAAIGLIAHLGILWWGLERNHRRNEQTLLPTLGYGNTITVVRGILTSLLAGFLLIPEPTTLLAWLPTLLYTTAVISDYFDGYVARLTNHTTILGEVLDMEFDGLGILIAIGVAIRYGQLPPWYLLLGLGRQLFILGIWLRQRRGLSTYDLTQSENRRIIAGFQMGFIAVILWPILSPPLTTLTCILFSIPLAASFGRDWLVVSGSIDPESAGYNRFRHLAKRILEGWGPTCCRLVGAAVCLLLLWPTWPSFTDWSTPLAQIVPPGLQLGWRLILVISPIFIGMFILGILSRVSGLLLLPLVFSNLLVLGGLSLLNVCALSALVWVIQFGGGNLCMWSPEEELLRRRAGE